MSDLVPMYLKMPSKREDAIVMQALAEFSELSTWRMNYAMQWEEVASLVMPEARNTFVFGNYNFPGMKKTELQVDASGMMALHRFGAICDSLLTPRNLQWHSLTANNKLVMKDRASRLWFEDATKALFRYRYAPNANFASQNQSNYTQLGAFGNMGMFVDALYSMKGERGLRYRSLPVGEIFLKENHQGQIDTVFRWFRLTAQQAYKQWPDTFPALLQPALQSGSQTLYDFIHKVCPRDDYDPYRLDYAGKPWASFYICLASKTLLQEGGYNTFPMPISRYAQAPGEVYGRGPGMMVLPALKTLNAEKKVFLKSGHRAADPVLLTTDDGVVDGASLKPGAVNKGGMSGDGKPLIGVLPTGNIQITKDMMDEEKGLINDAFLVSLFQILEETPQMSATEVIERVNEKGILIAPTMGRQQSEYLGPLIDRELDLLQQLRLLDPMPPALKEARGEYSVVYTSPLAKAMQSQEVAGFFRVVEQVKEIVAVTQDPKYLDQFDFDTAIPEIADQQAVPTRWMSTPQQISAQRQARAKAAQQQAQIQAAPAAAALTKANVNAVQSGVTPQQLQQFSQAPQGQPPQGQPPQGQPPAGPAIGQ